MASTFIVANNVHAHKPDGRGYTVCIGAQIIERLIAELLVHISCDAFNQLLCIALWDGVPLPGIRPRQTDEISAEGCDCDLFASEIDSVTPSSALQVYSPFSLIYQVIDLSTKGIQRTYRLFRFSVGSKADAM